MTQPNRAAPAAADQPTVAVVRLGCARNDVDSEELAARLESGGFALVDEPDAADAVLVNTCGFVSAAKKDSVDTVLQAAELKEQGSTQAVVAVGCLAERYGNELAAELPEADAVLGFDDYADIATKVHDLLAGKPHVAHVPQDRRKLLPISPVDRHETDVATPGHAARTSGGEGEGSGPAGAIGPASGPRVFRRRLDGSPYAPLKLASGCDRRCSFCAIPRFRGAFLSRPPEELVAEAHWLAEQGVREVFLVSENSTSYGKDLGDLRLLEKLLPELAGVDGIDRVRVSYLQPAEMRPDLVAAMAGTDGVVPYFDLSFQHASEPVLRRMRRFGDAERFLDLIGQVRAARPDAGIRSNVIVGFPGETDDDFARLCQFVADARLDVVGVFGYSDEDGTEAADFAGKLDEELIQERVGELTALVEQVTAQRAEERVGETVEVLVESVDDEGIIGRAAHQGPEVDGTTELVGRSDRPLGVGDLVQARVTEAVGVDLRALCCDGAAESVA